MTKRLAVLGLGHETNTFSPDMATQALYEDGGIERGGELHLVHHNAQTTYSGFLRPADDGCEPVPLFSAWVNPRGMITSDCFAAMVNEMTSMLVHGGPWDGVLLNLHGAAVAEDAAQADLVVAHAVRRAVGPSVPIGLVVDMHANLSPAIADEVDALFPYQTNPHVDPAERGRECRQHIAEIAHGASRCSVHIEPLPLTVNIVRQDTSSEPMRGLLALCKEMEESSDDVVDVSILEGFPYADVPQMGMTVSVTHRRGRAAAAHVSRQMAQAVWARRVELQGAAEGIARALDYALHRSPRDGTLLLLDVGDNVGGGGPGDRTDMLAAVLQRKLGGVLVTIDDPHAVRQLDAFDVGSVVNVAVGGRKHRGSGDPVTITGRLIARTDGHYEEPVISHGGLRHFDTGATVAIQTTDGVCVIVTSKLVQPISPQQITMIGRDPRSFGIIVAKGVHGPKAGFAGICKQSLLVDTPGIARLSIDELPYLQRRRPMFPFESDTTYPPATS